ncbi:MAG: hypothetical protein ACHQYR_03710, partial [Candidatus Gagatemarchaeaceae archaeon]
MAVASIPVGAELNLGIQVISLAIILLGLRFAIKTHNAFAQDKEDGAKMEWRHKNLMTSAVILSGLGAVVWMIPNYVFGWFYTNAGLDYGTGGYPSYYTTFGTV